MMGPFCSEQGTSSHETFKDLASTDEKTMFSGEEIGSEKKNIRMNKIHNVVSQTNQKEV